MKARTAAITLLWTSDDIAWGSTGKEARYLHKPRRLLGKTGEGDRKLILHMAQKMANR